ncbi:MAG: hypothetical protein HY360_04680 [Verrucomicrobia bacterium]|nr:hypothetical protein [Verrucomicrobiota bacterium]
MFLSPQLLRVRRLPRALTGQLQQADQELLHFYHKLRVHRDNLPARPRIPRLSLRAAAKRHGLEFYVTYKPYEWGGSEWTGASNGSSSTGARRGLPCVGGWNTWYDQRLLRHPEWRLHHRLPTHYPKLIKKPLARLTLHFLPRPGLQRIASKLRLWSSRDNLTYEPLTQGRLARASVVRYRLTDYFGRLMNRENGLALRVQWDKLDLSADWKFISVDGPKADWAILPCPWIIAQDDRGVILPLSYACAAEHQKKVGFNLGQTDGAFRFDAWGGGIGTVMQHGEPTFTGLPLAIARERNRARPGAPCEAEPGVRRAWHDDVDEILACRPDGLELRLQAHGMSSDDPNALTQNGALDMELKRRGIDPADTVAVMRARADLFLRWATDVKRKTRAARIPLVMPQQCFWANPEPPRLCLQSQPKLWPAWTEWLDQGQEVMLREHFYHSYAPDLCFPVKERAAAQRKPVWLQLFASQAGGHLRAVIVDEVMADPRIDGVVVYEWSVIRDGHDSCKIKSEYRPALARLGLAVR